jgi:hypothetical protein
MCCTIPHAGEQLRGCAFVCAEHSVNITRVALSPSPRRSVRRGCLTTTPLIGVACIYDLTGTGSTFAYHFSDVDFLCAPANRTHPLERRDAGAPAKPALAGLLPRRAVLHLQGNHFGASVSLSERSSVFKFTSMLNCEARTAQCLCLFLPCVHVYMIACTYHRACYLCLGVNFVTPPVLTEIQLCPRNMHCRT